MPGSGWNICLDDDDGYRQDKDIERSVGTLRLSESSVVNNPRAM